MNPNLRRLAALLNNIANGELDADQLEKYPSGRALLAALEAVDLELQTTAIKTPSPAPEMDSPWAEKRSEILAALRQCSGNQTRAAKILGISRRTMTSWMTAYRVPRPIRNIDTNSETFAAERARIIAALDQCSGNQTRAAKLLGVSRRTLVSRLVTYQIPRPRKPLAPVPQGPQA